MNDKINGRTPEEIKKGLECCVVEYNICDECPFADVYLCEEKLRDCAIILIKQLQEDNKQLERERDEARRDADKLKHAAKEATDNYFVMLRERDEARNDLDTLNYAVTELHSAYEAMKRERDAAVEEIDHICDNCKFVDRPFGVEPCPTMEENNFGNTCSNWQWRGVQEVH